ncbi:hypothetical protein HGQ17_05505 [Nesterenkonia sp. MY13]|uniref:Uncharacterized protein n=1 Tax=Nesterenkonia sedimenti TaxID=1463632 RepID=A0A7X8TIN8_9MICC|nr:hypothetical protein [Nesterenkonia sedimenti]NLS09471.1 hypothetical protein [Nesterenkonia sedimenti]
MLPLRQRILPILGVLLAAPITAEFLQAYLTLTGETLMLVWAVVFLAPLYGGAALLIREVTVRCGGGWAMTLLLAAAFGMALQTVVDLSMFAEDSPDVPYWSQIREPTLIPGLEVSALAGLSWMLGHVMLSVAAPLALLYALAPAHRGRPLLGRIGIPAFTAAWFFLAWQIHLDAQEMFGITATPTQWVGSLAVVVVLIALACLPRFIGQRREPASPAGDLRRIPLGVVAVAAILLKIAMDLMPSTWAGFSALVALTTVTAIALLMADRHLNWGPAEIGMLGIGVIIGAILIGFLAPLPPGVSMAAKLTQNSILLVAAVGLLVFTARRTGREHQRAPEPVK